MSDSLEELRIIARDARLTPVDRAVLIAAADELEEVYKNVTAMQSQLIEANAHRLALRDAVVALRKKETGFPVLTAHFIVTHNPLPGQS